jgi:hypothetical protein
MAEVDTQSLEILQTSTAPVITSSYTPIGIHDGRHTLYVARGPSLSAVDTRTLEQGEQWSAGSRIKGVQVSADAQKVYVAFSKEIVTLDAATLDVLQRADPPDVGRIWQMGPRMRSIQQPPLDKLTCAC